MRRTIFSLSALVFLCLFPLAVAGEGLPNHLFGAKVGEWALFSVPGGYTQKQTIVGRQGSGADADVTIRVETSLNGNLIDSQEITELAGDATVPQPEPEPGTAVTVTAATLAVKGTNYPVTVVTTTERDGTVESWHVSPDIPVYGLVKQVVDGKTEVELVDFGWN